MVNLASYYVNRKQGGCIRSGCIYNIQVKNIKHLERGACVTTLAITGYPVVNDPLYNHEVFGPLKGKGGDLGGKTDEELVRDLIHIHNAENWLGMDGDSELSMFNTRKGDLDDSLVGPLVPKGKTAEVTSILKFLNQYLKFLFIL